MALFSSALCWAWAMSGLASGAGHAARPLGRPASSACIILQASPYRPARLFIWASVVCRKQSNFFCWCCLFFSMMKACGNIRPAIAMQLKICYLEFSSQIRNDSDAISSYIAIIMIRRFWCCSFGFVRSVYTCRAVGLSVTCLHTCSSSLQQIPQLWCLYR